MFLPCEPTREINYSKDRSLSYLSALDSNLWEQGAIEILVYWKPRPPSIAIKLHKEASCVRRELLYSSSQQSETLGGCLLSIFLSLLENPDHETLRQSEWCRKDWRNCLSYFAICFQWPLPSLWIPSTNAATQNTVNQDHNIIDQRIYATQLPSAPLWRVSPLWRHANYFSLPAEQHITYLVIKSSRISQMFAQFSTKVQFLSTGRVDFIPKSTHAQAKDGWGWPGIETYRDAPPWSKAEVLHSEKFAQSADWNISSVSLVFKRGMN